MAGRIVKCRKLLFNKLRELGTPGTWEHIVNQKGMFGYTGLSGESMNLIYISTPNSKWHQGFCSGKPLVDVAFDILHLATDAYQFKTFKTEVVLLAIWKRSFQLGITLKATSAGLQGLTGP